MEKLGNYRGYHPLEFVLWQYNRYKNLEIFDFQRDQEITNFLHCYLLSYYMEYIIEVKDLLLSDDKESQLLGLQICCRDFIDTFNLIIEIDKNNLITNLIINRIIATFKQILSI